MGTKPKAFWILALDPNSEICLLDKQPSKRQWAHCQEACPHIAGSISPGFYTEFCGRHCYEVYELWDCLGWQPEIGKLYECTPKEVKF